MQPKLESYNRLKKAFDLYTKRGTGSEVFTCNFGGACPSKKEDEHLENALSQVFSPKQRELFLKKIMGEKLTKTEKEYFSRTVKKKAAALANTRLHRLAQQI